MALLVSFFLLSIVFSFLCSILEAVLLSVTPAYIKRKEQEGSSLGPLFKRFKADIDKPLSAILTLNTIAHTVGAIGVGAQAGKVFGAHFFNILGFQLSYESLVAILMTLGILFLSEIIPKTLGANNWRSLAPFTGSLLKALMWILGPFVWVSNLLTGVLKKDKAGSIFSKRDFAAMVDLASESGGINLDDSHLIKNVLRFDELKVASVMTPRTVMVTAEENQSVQVFFEAHKELVFSRIPLYLESKDNITGILLKDDLMLTLVDGKKDLLLSDIKRETLFVPADTSLRNAFKIFNEKHKHMALVVDEYGGVMGLVTLEDIIETLFGLEILDETDHIEDLQAFARKKWQERAKRLGLIE